MWTVVYMAQGREMAEEIRHVIQQLGVLVKLMSIGIENKENDNCFEILVPAAEIEEAHNIIIDIEF